MIKFPKAEAFDVLGIVVFGTMTCLGVRTIVFGYTMPEWMPWFLLLIGFLGFVIDSTVVFRAYAKKSGQID